MSEEIKKPVVIPLFFENYMSVIENSAGTASFQHWYCTVDGERHDVVKNGAFSCALYVTAILKMFGLVEDIQITVHRATAELIRSGWKPIDEQRPGAIVLWDAQKIDGTQWGNTTHLAKHIGFCLSNGQAISNRHESGAPKIDRIDYRPILGYFWNEKLGKK